MEGYIPDYFFDKSSDFMVTAGCLATSKWQEDFIKLMPREILACNPLWNHNIIIYRPRFVRTKETRCGVFITDLWRLILSPDEKPPGSSSLFTLQKWRGNKVNEDICQKMI